MGQTLGPRRSLDYSPHILCVLGSWRDLYYEVNGVGFIAITDRNEIPEEKRLSSKPAGALWGIGLPRGPISG